MTNLEITWMMQTLSQWLRAPADSISCPPDLNPGCLGKLLEKNRLLPLFQMMPIQFPATPVWAGFRDRLSVAYQRSLLQGLQQLTSGHTLMDCLAKAGINSLAVRGPFLAEDVYGDPAVRLSSDIDILVSHRDRRRAWKACQAVGYRSLDWECPLWPVDNHRIHWRLQRESDPVVCELHWAVEPVYGVMTLDYEALLRDRTPTQLFFLLCLHAGEHVLDAWKASGVAILSPEAAVQQGMVFRLLDVAMFLRKYGAEVDWDWIKSHARDRRVNSRLTLCLKGLRDWFGMPLPEKSVQCLSEWGKTAEIQRSSGFRRRLELWWERRTSRALGLETTLADVLYYLWPQAPFFAPSHGVPLMLKRVRHSLKASGVLSLELMSYACFVLITSIRRPMKHHALTWLAFLAISVFAHEFNDDYGDTAATAQAITLGSNVAGRIEIDVDQDWFSFQALHSTNEVVVTVTTGSLWNSTVGLAAPNGIVTLASTDSVTSVTARVSWIHIGPPATYYVRVAGFASFTTGTYTIAVSEQPYLDQDHDGMPDGWEIAYLGSTNQPPSGVAGDYDHDGVSNLDEFLAGTDPTNENSRFRVTGFSVTNEPHSVSWAAAPFRTYDVEVSTNLTGGGWGYLGTVTNLNDVGTLRYDDPTMPQPPLRFFRVRCLY